MRYIELKIIAKRAVSEAVQIALIDAGFEHMRIDDSAVAGEILADPKLYKYDYLSDEIKDIAEQESDDIGITLYFADDEEGREELARAKRAVEEWVNDEPRKGTDGPGVSFETKVTGDDSEWLYKWQEHFKPTKVGKRVVVKPSWEDYRAADGELVIEMDPGMAFGSGLHETTRMCIEGLEMVLGGELDEKIRAAVEAADGKMSVADAAKVLDIGTGTGILAMAAIMLGAEEALGIDIDDEAVRVGAENIERNGLADRIRIGKGDLVEGVDYKADILVANLMADLVIRLAPAAASHLESGGLFISSGILDVKEDVVAQEIERSGFDIIEILAEGEWIAVIAVRKADK